MGTPPSGARRLTFGCVPHVDDDRTRAELADFCRTLASRANVPVLPHRAPSPAALASAFGRGRVDVAWTSPGLFLTDPAMQDAVPLVSSVRDGDKTYHSVIFTLAGSKLLEVEDLRGARMAWVAQTSAAGYLLARLALGTAGIKPESDFSAERFLNSHGAVVRAVADGDADAGATYAVFEDGDPNGKLLVSGFGDSAPELDVRVLLAAGPIPSDLIVARADVPVTVRASLITALEALAENREAAAITGRIFNAERFERFAPGALDTLRSHVEAARELGLLSPP